MLEKDIIEGEIVEENDLDTGEEAEPEENEGEVELDDEGEPKDPPEGDDSDSDDEEEITVIIEGEEVEKEEPAPNWVKELRQKNREDNKLIKELQAKLEERDAPAKTALGEKPTLEGCDFDTEKFETDLESWHERKRTADDEAAKADKDKERQQAAWNEKLEAYGTKKAELKVADYDESEVIAQESLDVTQQGIIVQGAENPAMVIYALGANEKKLKELSAIKDPIKFAFAIAKLEPQLKVSGKKSPPPPEKKVSGTANSSGAVDSTLARLRKAAEKSGDYSQVSEYKRNKKQA